MNVVVTATCGASNAAGFTYTAILAQTGGGRGWPIAWLVVVLGASLATVGVLLRQPAWRRRPAVD